METSQKPEVFRTNIRISKEMELWLKRNAAKNFRSFNSEIVEMIRKAMTEEVAGK